MTIWFSIKKLKLLIQFTLFREKTIFSFSFNYDIQQLFFIAFILKSENNIKRFWISFKKHKKWENEYLPENCWGENE